MSAEESQQPDESLKRYFAYIAIPKYKKAFQEDGEYTKQLDTGKIAKIICTTEWRWGQCILDITEQQRKDITKNDNVCLNKEYHCEFCESTDGWKGEVILEDADSFTKEEKQEIMESLRIHGDDDDEENTDEEENPESKMKREDFNVDELSDYVEDCDTEYMEEDGGWGLDETYYYIYGGCVLVPEGEDIEDYAQDDGSYANKEETEQDQEPIVSVFNTDVSVSIEA